jgi:anti-sigma factor RsiW
MNPLDERLTMLLSCYLDGALEPSELDEVVVALETDLVAIAEFRRLRETRRAVRLLPILDPPLHLLPGWHLSEELSAFLDGELTTTELPAVATHLDSCVDCRHELADLDRSRTAVRAMPGLEPPEFLTFHREAAGRQRRSLRTAAAVAAGVAAVAIAFTFGPLSSSSEPSSVTISDLDARHAAVASVPTGLQTEIAGTSP